MTASLGGLRQGGRRRTAAILLHGAAGVGKTTLAAGAPDPVCASVEEGLGRLATPAWPIGSYDDLRAAIRTLLRDEHSFRTLVVDSVDALEPLVWEEACRRGGWDSIEAPGYGKGYIAAAAVWREYLSGLAALREKKRMLVVQIAHSTIRRFDSPDSEPYDRYQIKLQDRAAALLQEQADIVGFLDYRKSIRKADVGFNKKVARAEGTGQRVLYLEERPAFLAKNRYGMPPAIDLPTTAEAWREPQTVWAALAPYLPDWE